MKRSEAEMNAEALKMFAQSDQNNGLIAISQQGLVINNRLRQARERKGLTQEGLGALVGAGEVRIREFETLRAFPTIGQQMMFAARLRVPPEEMFPDWLQEFVSEPDKPEEDLIYEDQVSRSELLKAQAQISEFGEAEVDPQISAEREDRKDIIRGVVFESDSLTRNEKTVLIKRTGLEDDNPKTLRRVGREMGFTDERARQIEAHALRKLKENYIPRKKLKEYSEEFGGSGPKAKKPYIEREQLQSQPTIQPIQPQSVEKSLLEKGKDLFLSVREKIKRVLHI